MTGVWLRTDDPMLLTTKRSHTLTAAVEMLLQWIGNAVQLLSFSSPILVVYFNFLVRKSI